MSSARASQTASLLVLLLLLGACNNLPTSKGETPGTTTAYRVVHGWPVLPDGFVLGQVSGVAVDSHNHVFVFHRAHHSVNRTTEPISVPTIMCFDGETGKLISSWGADMFVLPHGLKVDNADNVWVTDLSLHQVFQLTHDGMVMKVLGTKGIPGTDDKHFNKPTDLAFAPDGSLYVSDGYGNNRVVKFSPKGDFLVDWGRKGSKPGEFDLPHGITVDSEGRVYVADRSNSRIQVFDADGKFLYEWKSLELGRPWGLTVGSDGYLYVVDGGDLLPRPPDRAGVIKLDLKGRVLEKWSSFGNYDGQLYWGHDIAVGANGDVYVGDVLYGMRVQKFTKTSEGYLSLHR